MKAALSSIGLGAILATAINVASAGPTATTSQTGTGNTAFTEQTLIDPTATVSATIIQVGNNNHAGDPVAQTPGILQRNAHGNPITTAEIQQLGNDNTASIVQDGSRFQVNPAKIKQIGDNNGATVVQTNIFTTYGLLRQEGVNNRAAFEQSDVGDVGIQGSQNGSDNFMTVRQYNHAGPGHAYVDQSGSLNAVTIDQNGTLGYVDICQIGDLNTVTSSMAGDGRLSIQQTGSGNTATTFQSGSFGHSSEIVQTGDNNLATLSQTVTGNYSLITQIGNSNQAALTQAGGNSAYINQVGNNFVASLTQTGAGNNGGIYQH